MGNVRCRVCTTWSYPCLTCITSKQRYKSLLHDLDSGDIIPRNPAEQQYRHRNAFRVPPQAQSQSQTSPPVQPVRVETHNHAPSVAHSRKRARRYHDQDLRRSDRIKKTRPDQEEYSRIIHGGPLLDDKSHRQDRHDKQFLKTEPHSLGALPEPSHRPSGPASWASPFRPQPVRDVPTTSGPCLPSRRHHEPAVLPNHHEPPTVGHHVPKQLSPLCPSAGSHAAPPQLGNRLSQIKVTQMIDGGQHVSRISVTCPSESISVNVSPGSIRVTTPYVSVSVTTISDFASTTVASINGTLIACGPGWSSHRP